jgi:hypothetical protein
VAGAERFMQFLDRIRRVRVHPPVPGLMSALRRDDQRVGILELRDQPIQAR